MNLRIYIHRRIADGAHSSRRAQAVQTRAFLARLAEHALRARRVWTAEHGVTFWGAQQSTPSSGSSVRPIHQDASTCDSPGFLGSLLPLSWYSVQVAQYLTVHLDAARPIPGERSYQDALLASAPARIELGASRATSIACGWEATVGHNQKSDAVNCQAPSGHSASMPCTLRSSPPDQLCALPSGTHWSISAKRGSCILAEQLVFAGSSATIASVGFYHCGDVLYVLEGIPGVWHESCLTKG
jgi:hypothetical protein